jgi:hypothetical protein
MKLEAHTRLRQAEIDAITYDLYSKVIASLDTSTVVAFGIPLPHVLKGLKGDIEKVAAHLKDMGVGITDIIKAFQERSVFKLLKGIGFSLVSLLKAVKSVVGLPGQSLFHAMGDLAEAFKDSKFMMALKPKERLAKLEALLKKHPVLAKISGTVIAGLLLLMYIKSSFTGNVDRDLELVDAVLRALHGNFSLVDMFASQDGLYAMAVLLFGVATGGTSLVDYGASALMEIAKFVDSNAYSLLLALFYTAAKKLKKHYDGIPHQLKAHRTQDWLYRLSHEERHAYLQKYPGSKFKDPTKIIHPNKEAQ